MHDGIRRDRTERLLALRLEELARALELAGAPAWTASRLLELATAATRQAVALELLTPERAEALWADARQRHPVLESVEVRRPEGLPARVAA